MLRTCFCRFYLCLWYKDDPNSQHKLVYYLTRLKSNIIVRDTGTTYSKLTRDSAKKITLALGQNSSFSRGFDKILHMLLVGALSRFLLCIHNFDSYSAFCLNLGKFEGELSCD